jgi:hypothetical protein
MRDTRHLGENPGLSSSVIHQAGGMAWPRRCRKACRIFAWVDGFAWQIAAM